MTVSKRALDDATVVGNQLIDSALPYPDDEPTERVATADLPEEPATASDAAAFLRGSGIELGTKIGEFSVTGILGQGGMGTVYAARHDVIGKQVAIKIISKHLSRDPNGVRRFIQEARAASEVGNRHLIDVYSFGELDDGRCYMVMEMLRGRSLYDRISAGPPPSVSEVVDILEQVALGVCAAHDKGIIHRDLKPDNVFLCRADGGETTVKVLDFGLAKLQQEDVGGSLTATGVFVGTPIYVAPEQARAAEVSPSTDFYSLSVIAFELLTGAPPFSAPTSMELISMHMSTPAPRVQDRSDSVPEALAELINRGLSKSPSERPSFEELLSQLRLVRRTLAGELPAPVAHARASTYALPRRPMIPRWIPIAAALVGIGLLVLVLTSLRQTTAASETSTEAASPAPALEQSDVAAANAQQPSPSGKSPSSDESSDTQSPQDSPNEIAPQADDGAQATTVESGPPAIAPDGAKEKQPARNVGREARRVRPRSKPAGRQPVNRGAAAKRSKKANDLLDDPFAIGK